MTMAPFGNYRVNCVRFFDLLVVGTILIQCSFSPRAEVPLCLEIVFGPPILLDTTFCGCTLMIQKGPASCSQSISYIVIANISTVFALSVNGGFP